MISHGIQEVMKTYIILAFRIIRELAPGFYFLIVSISSLSQPLSLDGLGFQLFLQHSVLACLLAFITINYYT